MGQPDLTDEKKRTRELKGAPNCDRMSCFANKKGSCDCLSENDFKDGNGRPRACPFYQPWSLELAAEVAKAGRRPG